MEQGEAPIVLPQEPVAAGASQGDVK